MVKLIVGGDNDSGQLGDGTYNRSYKPVLVDTNSIGNLHFISISSGEDHTCALATNNKIYCWGDNSVGELGDGSNINKNKPVLIDTSDISNIQFTSVASSYASTCAISDNEQAYCWGYNNYGQLGDGTNDNQNRPILVDTSSIGNIKFKNIALSTIDGFAHTCALSTNGQVYCWGNNTYGQLGDGKLGLFNNKPVAVNTNNINDKHFSSVFIGGNNTCATALSGKIYCWGDNPYKVLKFNDTTIEGI